MLKLNISHQATPFAKAKISCSEVDRLFVFTRSASYVQKRSADHQLIQKVQRLLKFCDVDPTQLVIQEIVDEAKFISQ